MENDLGYYVMVLTGVSWLVILVLVIIYLIKLIFRS